MAKVKQWLTVTPLARPIVQAAIDAGGMGGEISFDSWVPYPSEANPKLYYVGWGPDEELQFGLVFGLVVAIAGLRVRRGPLRPTDPAATRAQVLSANPLPNIGPAADLVMTLPAALGLHYRDFVLGTYDDNGAPG